MGFDLSWLSGISELSLKKKKERKKKEKKEDACCSGCVKPNYTAARNGLKKKKKNPVNCGHPAANAGIQNNIVWKCANGFRVSQAGRPGSGLILNPQTKRLMVWIMNGVSWLER